MRTLRFLLLCLFLGTPSVSADNISQVILSGSSTALATSGTQYLGAMGAEGIAPSTTEEDHEQIVPTAGTFFNLNISLSTAPGAGTSRTFTLRNNAGDTSITCTISETDSTCRSAATAAVAVGDEITYSSTVSGTPAGTRVRLAISFLGTTPGASMLMGNNGANGLSTSATEYLALSGNGVQEDTAAEVQNAASLAGTITVLRVVLGTAPGAGDSRTFDVFPGGTESCTISESDTSCAVAISQAVVAANLYYIRTTISGTPAATEAAYSVDFIPTTLGQFPIGSAQKTVADNTQTTYNFVQGGSTDDGTTETARATSSESFNVLRIDVRQSTNSGTGNTWTYTLQDDTADTACSCAISGGSAVTCTTTATCKVTAGSRLENEITPASTPTEPSRFSIGYAGFHTNYNTSTWQGAVLN